MRIDRNQPAAFKPFSVVIESRDELISLRALADAVRLKKKISDVMEHWGRTEDHGVPQPADIERFARKLNDLLCGDGWDI